MTGLTMFMVGILIGWITKVPFLLKWYKEAKSDKRHISEIVKNFEEDSKCGKVLKEIHLEWGENWDLVIDFFGQETADKIDKAVGYDK
jgi:hypothetical protein